MEAAVRELKQQAQDAAASADRNKKEREAAAEETTKLETLSAELKAQLEKASAAHEQVSLHHDQQLLVPDRILLKAVSEDPEAYKFLSECVLMLV